MLALRSRASSLIASIIASLPGFYRLLLRAHHVAVLAQGSKIVRHVRAVGDNVVHLIRWVTAEHAQAAISPQDHSPNLVPVLRELLATA